MKIKPILFLCFILAALLTGCVGSTMPVTQESAKRVSSERIFLSDIASIVPNDNKGKVLFLRDSGIMGSAIDLTVYANSVKLFEIGDSEYITIYLNPGSYLFRLGAECGICSSRTLVSQSIYVKGNEAQTFRIQISNDGTSRLIKTK